MTKEGTPAVLFRNSIDLNRFSNGVSRKIVQSNIDVIIRAAKQLSKIDPSRPPSYKTARLRSLIKQTKESLSTWEKESVDVMIRELEGLAGVQAGFVEDQIAQALPNGVLKTDLNPLGYSVQTVAVSPSFAKAVVTKDPSVLSLKSTGTFDLTAAQGAEVLLPNGETVQKAFRGLASRQATQFNQVVRTGLLSGETTESIVSQLIGNLQFGQGAKTNQQYLLAGKEVLNMASHQIRTVVRTSINQVSNAASQQVYKANEDITEKYKYVSTLDSRTTALCASLDGKEFEYGKGPEPPQHFNCRSTTVAVIDYDALKKMGWDFDVPKEGRRAAAGGMVPANETYGKWLYGQRKAGTKFTPGVRQIEALGKEKAKYFNRLANKYGADDAIKKFVREDGSEVSLFQLKKRYGKPESITVKKKTAPKGKVTPVKTLSTTKATTDTWQPTSDFKEGIKRGESMTKGRFEKTKTLAKEYKKAFNSYEEASEKYFTYSYSDAKKEAAKVLGPLASRDEVIKFYRDERIKLKQSWVKNKAALTKLEVEGAKEMAILRKETLKTTVTDKQIKERLDSIPFTNQKKADRLKVRSEVEEFAKIFNGGGVTVKSEGALDGQISAVKLGTSRAKNNWKGEILVPFADPQNSYMELLSKQTVFHEIGHSLETSRKANLNMAVNWRTSRVISNAPTKTKVKKAWTLSEGVLPDEFITPYVGRPYRSRNRGYKQGFTDTATEVISMGVEHFASPELMFRLYSVDPDHFHMILSLTRNVYGG